MASNLSTRAVRSACIASKAAPRSLVTLIPRRSFATNPETAEPPTTQAEQPRWSYTPPQAKAPFSLHMHSGRPEFHNNSDPEVLDKFYIRMLGNGGENYLSEETKWLAVTHKSFDQGRRGFNDRLAFLGKRIVQLQASLALAQNPTPASSSAKVDEFGREPFSHAALDGLRNLSPSTKSFLTDRSKLAELAQKYEMQKVVRWEPRKPNNLMASGLELVLAHTMYAIIGAISLEKGGHIANKVAQERILEPLGIRSVS
ncbi:uncharacterized protein N7483_002740 [Penicillium malachiteum]|uniref:RNase III domain-containing protein n=1 Tax=Penicillium malachiteum TaxID=1324776 RepID=A0AAD6HHA0_9EURO|nr:uncharacterized protein N7483_002740 [Penicillium malachiteum]KAJ5716495.1 hypothetical protein N7493_008406 [Penicillium malachiteum]KAJ5737615.1 hypothetical protein N7483_002740 [Penicillium malachiteum]